MNYLYRVNKWNKSTKMYDTYFPQTVTSNILRRDNGGVLEKWLKLYDSHLMDDYPHINHAVSRGYDHRHLIADIANSPLVDGYPLLLRLHTNLETEPTLDFNESGEKWIVNGAGERIAGGQTMGGVLFLTWNKEKDVWVSLSQDGFGSMTKIMLPVVSEYCYEAKQDDERIIQVPGFNYREDLLQLNYGQTILRYGIDYNYIFESPDCIELSQFGLMKDDILVCRVTKFTAISKRGNVKYEMAMKFYHVPATDDYQTLFIIPVKARKANFLEVNYNQTILRQGIDYTIDDDGVRLTLKHITLMKDEVLSFRAIRLVESNGDVVPSNWGATGNYRYSYKVQYEEFTSDRDGTVLIPVPEFNQNRDELTVIRDNKVLILNADYYIDNLDQIVLVNETLDAGETIYFTIRKGSMVDVPNFYTTEAKGTGSQHLNIDISDNQLCNHYALAVRLRNELKAAPTLKTIDGPARPIVDGFGNPIQGGYQPGAYLFVIYNEDQKCWYSMSHGQYDISGHFRQNEEAEGIENFIGRVSATIGDDHEYGEVVIPHGLSAAPSNIQIIPIEPPETDPDGTIRVIGDIWTHSDETSIYVGNTGNAHSKFRWIAQTTSANTDFKKTLSEAIEELKNRPGNLFTRTVVFQATVDDTSFIILDDYDPTEDKVLLVNYGQTILRQNMDYILDNKGIMLTSLSLAEGEIVQIVLVKQPKKLVPSEDTGYLVGRFYLKSDDHDGAFYEFDPSKFVLHDNETGQDIPFIDAVFGGES